MLARAYSEKVADVTAEVFECYTTCDPYHKEDHWFVATEGARVVSALKLFCRPVALRGQTFQMAGVGNVGTDPEFRGRGHATALLRRAIAYMEHNGFALSILYTGSPGLYERLGWRRIWAVRYQWSDWQMPPVGQTWQVRGAELDDLDQVAAIYRQRVQPYGLATVRDLAYWRSWICEFSLAKPNRQGLVAVGGGQLAAYALVSHRQNTCHVIEGGCLADRSDALAAILLDAAGHAEQIVFPEMPDLLALAEAGTGRLERHEASAGMVRFVAEPLDLAGAGFILTEADGF